MDFKQWLLQTKLDKPELSDFITKLDSFFTETGFNSTDFERKIDLGLNKIEKDIETTLIIDTNENKESNN